ncbi:hypothetical protein SUGI_0703090 [Cryptomeria japonica]|nr:hypothetical protein SUGI_0703090 [Cryptomeria japonica]
MGREVSDVSALGGYASGKATGGAPKARLATYKVCWPLPGGNEACTSADILAALHDALGNGVHVLNISIGGTVTNYLQDAIALGSLYVLKQGVVVVCSAGNNGPELATTSNLAPWIITVAASSVDRDFPSPILFSDGSQAKVHEFYERAKL